MLPRLEPRLGDDREPGAPLLIERFELGVGLVGILGGVDRLQIAGDLLAFAAGHVLEACANQVHQACLDGRGREDRFDRFREPGEPVHAADQDLADAAGLQVGEDLHPELGALGLLKPHPEHVPVALQRDPEREVQRAALHAAAVADLEHHAVQEHDRVDVLQRPLAPVAHVVHDRVGHAADQVRADIDAVDLVQVRADVADRQAAAVERQDLVVEPDEPPLTLAHDLRLEAAVAVSGSV